MEESKDVILKGRFPDTEANEIKIICQEKSEQWNRVYTVSDFLRDAACLYKIYHPVKEQLIVNKDLIFSLAFRLPGRGNPVNGTVVPQMGHEDNQLK